MIPREVSPMKKFLILLLATMAPTQPSLTLGIVAAFMVAINILLFRSFIFRKKSK